MSTENHVEFKTYLIKWKPVLCENNENVPERKATVQVRPQCTVQETFYNPGTSGKHG